MSSASIELFVYGTLRSPIGGPPGDTHYHSRIAESVTASRPGWLHDAELIDCGAFPAVGRGRSRVRGEVLTITENALAECDVIEGHPDFYERQLATIGLDDGSKIEAWVYWAPESLLTAPGHRSIPSGDWFVRERIADFPAPFEFPDDPAVAAAFERFVGETCSWLSTVRPNGRPHLVPMWHAVVGNRIYFVTEDTSSKVENVARTPHVVVSHPDPEHVVFVEGWAIEAPHLLEELAPLFIDKYDWDPRNQDSFPGMQTVIEVTPRVLHSWQDEKSHRRWVLD